MCYSGAHCNLVTVYICDYLHHETAISKAEHDFLVIKINIDVMAAFLSSLTNLSSLCVADRGCTTYSM
jgi:hypothetical protein